MACPLSLFAVVVAAAGRIKTNGYEGQLEQRAGSCGRFNRLFPEWLTRSDLMAATDCRVVGASPAWEVSAAALMKVLPEVPATTIAVVLTAIHGMDVSAG